MINEKIKLKKRHQINLDFEPVLNSLILYYIKQNEKKERSALKNFISLLEKNLIYSVLDLTKGNQKIASEILGVGKTTLNEKIKRYCISLSDFKFNMSDLVEEQLKLTNIN